MLGLLCLSVLAVPSLGVSWDAYTTALETLNWTAVDEAITNVLTTSNASFWPADYGTYGPLMIRLGWHCAGSYRKSDGRGGCSGGRIRFSPEGSWDDNANLDKARALLEPVKAKFPVGLSYGDLYIRAATVAIKNMGGPVLGFCAGRFDDVDGTESLLLGPSAEQNATYPCADQGDCKEAEGLGPTTIGLIYVNPGGPKGNGNATQSAPQIRDSFGRMDMDDRETVALIGGGHSFGKSHGACVGGGGAAPNWVGSCNASGMNGKGVDTHTSGFEGPWTATPTRWSNLYFTALRDGNWTPFIGAGGNPQFHDPNQPMAPQVDGSNNTVPIAMLVSDISLTIDPAYNALVNEYAASLTNLTNEFKAAWYKLTTRDMGPSKRCHNNTGGGVWAVPPSQAWQFDLPAPNVATLPDYAQVKAAIRALPGYGPAFAQLAWQCASTYRQTDYRGGCNGARIRFAPENQTAANVALNSSALIAILGGLKANFSTLSYADAIVLAGHAVIEDALGNASIPFCGGRTDATDGSGSMNLDPLNWTNVAAEFREKAARMGLTLDELVVLQGVPRPAPSTAAPTTTFFAKVVGNDTADMNRYDLAIRGDSGLKAIAQSFADNTTKITEVFPVAWNKVMNADFFIGWNGLTCPKVLDATTQSYSAAPQTLVGLASVLALFAIY